MLCFITFIGISSFPWDSLGLSDLVTFSISLVETHWNSHNGGGSCKISCKYVNGFCILPITFELKISFVICLATDE